GAVHGGPALWARAHDLEAPHAGGLAGGQAGIRVWQAHGDAGRARAVGGAVQGAGGVAAGAGQHARDAGALAGRRCPARQGALRQAVRRPAAAAGHAPARRGRGALAGVPDAVAVAVGLVRVRDVGAHIARIADAVAVAVGQRAAGADAGGADIGARARIAVV